MFTKNALLKSIFMIITIILLTACTPQAVQTPITTSKPISTATQIPSSVPSTLTPTAPLDTAVNATPTLSATSTSVNTQGPTFEGLSTGLDNSTQARIRTISEVLGAYNTDVYINGMPAFDGGVAQQEIIAGVFSGWLYVAPGTYTVALVRHGGTIDQALFPPVDVNVEAGHRYTVSAMGQLADKDVHPLVVDETTLEAGLSAKPTDLITIDINNMIGADSITEMADGKPTAENIKYGEVRGWVYPSGTPLFKTVANAKTAGVLYEGSFQAEPGTSFVLPWFGPYPVDSSGLIGNLSQGTSELNVLDFLAGFDGRNVVIERELSTFNTFLTAIDKAGLHDQLVNSGPYFLLAPIDAAFDALPQTDRDALLNDPQALMDLLNAHIVDGYYPLGSLTNNGLNSRTLTNRLGNKLVFEGETINGESIQIGANYTVGNGNRVAIIDQLLPYK
jgi:hypothetical protein